MCIRDSCRHTRSRSVGDTRGGADGEENISGDRCGGGPAALACRATEDGGGGQPGGGREDDPQVRRRGRGGGDPSGDGLVSDRAGWAAPVAAWFPELVDAQARSRTWPELEGRRELITKMIETNTLATVHQRLRVHQLR